MRGVWWLPLAWMTGGPLAVLGGSALLVISSAHSGVRGPLALPAVCVAYVSPRVPHVGLRPVRGTPRHRWRS